jgi:transposase
MENYHEFLVTQIIAATRVDSLNAVEYSSKNMDHRGIVARVCKEIGLVDQIDQIVDMDPRQKVTCDEAVAAMVLNALGFVDRPRYLFPDSMSLQGDYKHEEGDLGAVPIQITHGFSKDGRPDLKQLISSLVLSDSVPVFIQALSGNTADKRHFREFVITYGQPLQKKWGEDKIQRRGWSDGCA